MLCEEHHFTSVPCLLSPDTLKAVAPHIGKSELVGFQGDIAISTLAEAVRVHSSKKTEEDQFKEKLGELMGAFVSTCPGDVIETAVKHVGISMHPKAASLTDQLLWISSR